VDKFTTTIPEIAWSQLINMYEAKPKIPPNGYLPGNMKIIFSALPKKLFRGASHHSTTCPNRPAGFLPGFFYEGFALHDLASFTVFNKFRQPSLHIIPFPDSGLQAVFILTCQCGTVLRNMNPDAVSQTIFVVT